MGINQRNITTVTRFCKSRFGIVGVWFSDSESMDSNLQEIFSIADHAVSPDDAMDKLKAFAFRQPENTQAWTYLSALLLNMDKPLIQVLALILNAVRSDPLMPNARYTLGMTYFAQGNFISAKREFLAGNNVAVNLNMIRLIDEMLVKIAHLEIDGPPPTFQNKLFITPDLVKDIHRYSNGPMRYLADPHVASNEILMILQNEERVHSKDWTRFNIVAVLLGLGKEQAALDVAKLLIADLSKSPANEYILENVNKLISEAVNEMHDTDPYLQI